MSLKKPPKRFGGFFHARRSAGDRLKSFRPVIDERCRVLVLGSMPGPEALRRREYYGFTGNHFWRILEIIFEARSLRTYAQKKEFLLENHIALWDVISTCTRQGSSDSSIRQVRPNALEALLRRYPGIDAVFLNGRTAERFYRKYFTGKILLPVHVLPSTSPAHAALSLQKKAVIWKVLLKYLRAKTPWC